MFPSSKTFMLFVILLSAFLNVLSENYTEIKIKSKPKPYSYESERGARGMVHGSRSIGGQIRIIPMNVRG